MEFIKDGARSIFDVRSCYDCDGILRKLRGKVGPTPGVFKSCNAGGDYGILRISNCQEH